MAALTLFHEFKKYVLDGTIDLDGHTFKAMLTDTAPSAANNTVKADITEIAVGNGYTSGGTALTSVTLAETAAGSGIWQFGCADITFTASGGDIATHRYLVIYDDTPTSPADPLVGYIDRGSSAVIASGGSRIWDIGSSGLIQVS